MEIGGTESVMTMRTGYPARERVTGNKQASQGDTVSLSSEAKRLLEYFRSKQVNAMDRDDTQGTSSAATTASVGKGADGTSSTSVKGVDAGESSGAAGNSGSGSQVEDIEKRIKDLMDKVKHIMDSDLPPEQKQSAAAPYLQQIQELQQQLQQLMTEQLQDA
ncbi:FlxA-like protein [Desulfomicrobium apsheronum]|uniref:FlxA-like protein n=1 Tax=Desulfomicrobium apsheronum TaxID=52560 RepID=A0A1I3SA22_9BACT|nr:FlxA-like family protein [Desulfomicrobium apsheronum]SFJ54366.1 FlxA-like protein [Desulfomicrobium apsheronum]